MDYLSHNVSENLKRIRQSKGMSLDQVAEQTGVSKSMLAQIEKGTANPSIGVLGKITSGLRIELQRLIDPPRVDYALISPDDLVPTKELLGQYRVWTCFPYEDSREVEVYRIDVEPVTSVRPRRKKALPSIYRRKPRSPFIPSRTTTPSTGRRLRRRRLWLAAMWAATSMLGIRSR